MKYPCNVYQLPAVRDLFLSLMTYKVCMGTVTLLGVQCVISRYIFGWRRELGMRSFRVPSHFLRFPPSWSYTLPLSSSYFFLDRAAPEYARTMHGLVDLRPSPSEA